MPQTKLELPEDNLEAAALCEKHGFDYMKETAELLGPGFDRLEEFLAKSSQKELLMDFKFIRLSAKADSRYLEMILLRIARQLEVDEESAVLKAALAEKYESLKVSAPAERDALLKAFKDEIDFEFLRLVPVDYYHRCEMNNSKKGLVLRIPKIWKGRETDFWDSYRRHKLPRNDKWIQMKDQADKLEAYSCDIWTRFAESISEDQTELLAKVSAWARHIFITFYQWCHYRVLRMREMSLNDASFEEFAVLFERHIPVTIPEEDCEMGSDNKKVRQIRTAISSFKASSFELDRSFGKDMFLDQRHLV